MAITTEACGDASGTRASGIPLGDGRVLTVAHAVIGSSALQSTDADGRVSDGVVVALDPERDLALVELDDPAESGDDRSPEFGVAQEGTTGVVTGADGSVAFVVRQAATVRIDVVGSDESADRPGLRLRSDTSRGDSGAGLWNDEGALVGILFATSTSTAGESWATRASAVRAFLDDPSVVGRFECDPLASELTRR